MEPQQFYYFSIFSGEIYSVAEDERDILDAFQIPLTQKPKDNCRKCYGRFYTAYNVTSKHYEMCKTCAKKYVDLSEVLRKNSKKK